MTNKIIPGTLYRLRRAAPVYTVEIDTSSVADDYVIPAGDVVLYIKPEDRRALGHHGDFYSVVLWEEKLCCIRTMWLEVRGDKLTP